jgi:hypothetical protein
MDGKDTAFLRTFASYDFSINYFSIYTYIIHIQLNKTGTKSS